MDAFQINERFGRLLRAQHEVLISLANLQVAVVQAVIEAFPESADHLLDLTGDTGTAIQAATLLLSEVPDAG